MNKLSLRTLLFFVILLLLPAVSVAQQCVINGRMGKDSLRFSKARLNMVYLSQVNEFDQFVKVDSALVQNGVFRFSYSVDPKAPLLMYFITGFDNGEIPVWLEPGEITVQIRDAAFPSGALVRGTSTNELYNQYKAFGQQCIDVQNDTIRSWAQRYGATWLDSPEGRARMNTMGAAEVFRCESNRLQFLLDYNDSPLAPLMMEREMVWHFSQLYAERMVKSLSPSLATHPYFLSFSNYVKAQNLRVGGELPDIKIPLADGTVKHLSDYRGKYVVLDFWASWCVPCIKELPLIKRLYQDTRDKSDRFALISFSLDNKEPNWRNAMTRNDMVQPGWIHASDLLGWGSPAAKLLGIEAIPKMIIVDPEGKAVSFDLRGEELVRKMKSLLEVQ